MAFRHLFVLHAILGLATLHIAYYDAPETCSMWMDGIYYHNKALNGFQRAVTHVTEQNSEGLFIWSICNITYTFAMSNPLRHTPDVITPSTTSTQYDKILGAEWIPMIRGLDAVLGPTYDFLRLSRMSAKLSLGNWDKLDPNDGDQSPEDVYFLSTCETWKSSTSSEVYEEALHVLRKCRIYSQQFRTMDSETLNQWGLNKEWSGLLSLYIWHPRLIFHFSSKDNPLPWFCSHISALCCMSSIITGS